MSSYFQKFSEKHTPKINQIMCQHILKHCTEEKLKEAMIYSVEAGGKRLRPLLLLSVVAFHGEKIEKKHYQLAAALEMIHTYSLIHDDLPAMDNDDLRRGKPTNHKVFGEATAILAGDALLTEAFHLLSLSPFSSDTLVKMIQEFAKASGSYGMVAGQLADMEAENTSLTLSELKAVHARKTGALIECAVNSGLLSLERTLDDLKSMQTFAQHFGVAFQIKDDLLDVVGNEAEIGKKIGMDALLHKSTYPFLLGVDGAKEALEQECLNAEIALNHIMPKNERMEKFSFFDELLLQLRKL
ncbi:polyprenyl synthetase family protein [Vagococcus entomophilus]|uniref:Farnesyl diphosphate synthase n=1 Tax=Vagococcus entomophilus TaxID=1160095 RepID=A0A430AIS4_9ENTE|nr:farnesyl diphosphate synthase [Vagococcus entomophilus]RSU07817.1 geranyl transferase [Vagococcus entomophilus]